MRFQKIVLLCFGTLFTLNCSDNKITSPRYFDQFPLRVGMFWEYESQHYRLYKEIVSYERMPNGKKGYRLDASLVSKDSSEVPQKADQGYLTFQDDQLREYPDINCPSLYSVLLQFPLAVGQGWYKHQGMCCDTFDCQADENGVIICKVACFAPLTEWDTVTTMTGVATPYASFTDCFEIRGSAVVNIHSYAYFKPRVGFVRYRSDQYIKIDPDALSLPAGEDFVLVNFGIKNPGRAPWR